MSIARSSRPLRSMTIGISGMGEFPSECDRLDVRSRPDGVDAGRRDGVGSRPVRHRRAASALTSALGMWPTTSSTRPYSLAWMAVR